MGIELGKINVTDLKENDYKVLGIGINKSSNQGGMFAVNYTTLTQAKDNITNLLMTKKGERLGQPEFGCDIWRVLFEPIVDGEIDDNIDYVFKQTALERLRQSLSIINNNMAKGDKNYGGYQLLYIFKQFIILVLLFLITFDLLFKFNLSSKFKIESKFCPLYA